MRFCQSHWDRLKKAIEDRGLNHLIAKDGKEAMQQAIKQLQGVDDKRKDYDPLMSAHWQIVENAIKAGGLYIMMGDICPLCEVDKHQAEMQPGNSSDDWIKYASDAQLEYAKSMGLQG